MQGLLQVYIRKYGSQQTMSVLSHLVVQQVLGLRAVGLPGNGLCELGELPTPSNAGTATPAVLSGHHLLSACAAPVPTRAQQHAHMWSVVTQGV